MYQSGPFVNSASKLSALVFSCCFCFSCLTCATPDFISPATVSMLSSFDVTMIVIPRMKAPASRNTRRINKAAFIVPRGFFIGVFLILENHSLLDRENQYFDEGGFV